MRHAIVCALFILLISVPAVSALLGARSESFENRPLAPLPRWSAQSWLDADAYGKLSDWLSDALPLRSPAIAFDAWLDFVVFGDSPNANVLVGRDGELFLRDELVAPCTPAAAADAVLARVGAFARLLTARGVDVYLMISPDKASLYPDRLPAYAQAMNRCVSENRRELRRRLAEPTRFTNVDLWTPLEREVEAGHRVFPKLGRHWDQRSAMVQARVLVETIQPGLWQERFVVPDGSIERPAELPARFMNLDLPQRVERFRVERPGVEVRADRFRVPEATDVPVEHYTATSRNLPLIPGRTLVVQDSFMMKSAQAVADYAEDVRFVHWSVLRRNPEATAEFFAAADRVILQLVEDRRGVVLGKRGRRALQVLQARLGPTTRPHPEVRAHPR